MSDVVIGVGNEYRRDDGVGPAVVTRLRDWDLPGVRLADCDGETGRLLDLWRDADVAIVVDAVRVRHPEPGRIHRRSLRHPGMVGRPASSHGSDLGAAVELARALDRLPRLLLLYAVEVADTSFGVGLTPPVEAAVERLATEVATELRVAASPRAPGLGVADRGAAARPGGKLQSAPPGPGAAARPNGKR